MDFYFATYDSIKTAQPILMKIFHVNAYTINAPKPFNILYALVNWYGGAALDNDGSYVPSFLRITGYFNANEKNEGNDMLAIFFDNIDFFRNAADDWSFDISCTSSIGAVPTKCRGFNNVRTAPN